MVDLRPCHIYMFQFSNLTHGEPVITTGFAIQTYIIKARKHKENFPICCKYILHDSGQILCEVINELVTDQWSDTLIVDSMHFLQEPTWVLRVPIASSTQNKKMSPLAFGDFLRDFMHIFLFVLLLYHKLIFGFLCICASSLHSKKLKKMSPLALGPHWEFCARFRAN